MAVEPQLVPTLREGIQVIKMVLYQELKSLLLSRHKSKDPVYVNNLTGAVVNDLFGSTHPESVMQAFSRANLEALEKTVQLISAELDHLRIPLTDALRIQFLCDSHEGKNNTSVLEKAEKQGILIVERDVPLPGAFMNIVRSFGRAYGILDPQAVTPPATTQMNKNGAEER